MRNDNAAITFRLCVFVTFIILFKYFKKKYLRLFTIFCNKCVKVSLIYSDVQPTLTGCRPIPRNHEYQGIIAALLLFNFPWVYFLSTTMFGSMIH